MRSANKIWKTRFDGACKLGWVKKSFGRPKTRCNDNKHEYIENRLFECEVNGSDTGSHSMAAVFQYLWRVCTDKCQNITCRASGTEFWTNLNGSARCRRNCGMLLHHHTVETDYVWNATLRVGRNTWRKDIHHSCCVQIIRGSNVLFLYSNE